MINDLAKEEKFVRMIGSSQQARMKDAELVLRYLAFSKLTYLNYQNGMKNFLNTFMEENIDLDSKIILKLKQKFKDSIDLAFSVFGENAFRRFSKGNEENPNGEWERSLNRSVFDVILWSFSNHSKNQIMEKKDLIKDAFIKLNVNNEVFLDAITTGTGDKLRVTKRFEIWKKCLDDILSDKEQNRNFSYEIKKQHFDNSNTCALCKQEITHIDDAEMDHIMPFSKGGKTISSNGQLTHRYCNRRKSNS